jgi:cysteine desulfurase / selenocysteine lyase
VTPIPPPEGGRDRGGSHPDGGRRVDWAALRDAEFPSLHRWTYLNAAGAPPMSRCAAADGQRYYAEMADAGDLPWERWLGEIEDVRRLAASLLNAAPDEIAFTVSASHAFSLIAPLLGPPAHVVMMEDEYPSATLPFLRHGDRATFVAARPDGVIPVDDVEAAIRADTRAVVTSTVMFRTGFRQDLRTLSARCRARGVPLVVDASQSLGAFPLDVEGDGIDLLGCSGYKWLMAGYGIGVLYVQRLLLQRAGSPVAGWFSQRDPDAFVHDRLDLKLSAGALEVGSPHFAGIFALGGALRLLTQIGGEAIAGRIHDLTDYLHRALDAADFTIASPRARDQRAGITIVRTPDAAAAVSRLAAQGIIVAARGAGLRVSVHVFNNEADIDRLVAALVALRKAELLGS